MLAIMFTTFLILTLAFVLINQLDWKEPKIGTIQKAIDEAKPGDRIIIKTGTYYEHIVVDKTISLIGEDRKNTIIDGNCTGTVIHVKSNNTIISGFTIRNSGIKQDKRGYIVSYYEGVCFDKSYNCSISGNDITDNGYGISLFWSANNTISGNYLSRNLNNIVLESSKYNEIYGNNMENSGGIVIVGTYQEQHVLGASTNNIISGNNMTLCEIRIFKDCSYNVISGNNIKEHVNPSISLQSTSNNNISGNYITNNLQCGISLSNAKYNRISGNNITNNGIGIEIDGSNNIIFSNLLRENKGKNSHGNGAGIVIRGSKSKDNIIYNNDFVDNDQHIINFILNGETQCPINIWDDGYLNGGNYWSDYIGVDLYSGLYQNIAGSDGIGDTPYIIDEINQDHYPLMNATYYKE